MVRFAALPGRRGPAYPQSQGRSATASLSPGYGNRARSRVISGTRCINEKLPVKDRLWWLQHTAAALTVLFAVTYGVVRMATDAFYGRLGLRPEDINVNGTAIIAPAATCAGLLFAAVLATILAAVVGWQVGSWLYRGLILAPWRWVRTLLRWLTKQRQARGMKFTVALAVLFLVVYAVALVRDIQVFNRLQQPSRHGIAGDAGETLLMMFGSGLALGFGYGWVNPSAVLRRVSRAYLAPAALVLSLAVPTVLFSDFAAHANALANDVLHNRLGKRDASTYVWLPIHLSSARVVPTSNSDVLSICDGRKMVYLIGRSGEGAFVLVFPSSAPGQLGEVGEVDRLRTADYYVNGGLDAPVP